MDKEFFSVTTAAWRPSSSDSAYRKLTVRAGEMRCLPDGDTGIVELYLVDVDQVGDIQQVEDAQIDLALSIEEDQPGRVITGTPRFFAPPLPGEEVVRLELVGAVEEHVRGQVQ